MHKRRTRRLVERFQHRWIYRMVMYCLVYQFTIWNVMFAAFLIREGSGNLGDQYQQFTSTHYPMLLCFVVLVPVIIWDANRFHHRIAGPVYRLRSTIQAITQGESVPLLKFRENDELQGLATDFNKMLDALASRDAAPTISTTEDALTEDSQSEKGHPEEVSV